MYELVRLGTDTFYFDCPSRVGVVRLCERDVCLIDSGATPEAAKRMDQILAQNGWRVSRIISTHAHASHCGGNAYFYDRYGCRIFAPPPEDLFARQPLLPAAMMWGGCAPRELQIPRLTARPAPALPLTGARLAPDFELCRLDGHAPAMVGVKTRDGVWFVGDAVTGEEEMRREQIPHVYDARAYLRSLDTLETLQGTAFVASHAPAAETLLPLIIQTRVRIRSLLDTLCALCEEPLCFDSIVKAVFDHYALTLTPERYAVTGSSLRAFLSCLCAEGRMEMRCENNLLVFCTAP